MAAKPAGSPPAGAARDAARGEDAGGDGDDLRSPDDAGAAARPDEDSPDGKAPEAGLSEADAIALARKARDEGDTEGLDRALKVIFPGSKGLAEFNVDGKRYGEFRITNRKAQQKLDAQAADLQTQAQNLERGRAVLQQVVQRLEPIEQLVKAAQDESPEGVAKFVELIEKATNKPLNETLRRHLSHKLDKPGDPEVEALKRELKSEKEARLERERKEAEARDQAARAREIQGHLAFLDETLSKHDDQRVRALVKTPEGIKAIFLAQRSHYNAQSRTTISAEQAARLVLEQKAKELEPWRAVLGGAPTPSSSPPAAKPANDAPPAVPADRARPLGSRGSAPATGSGGRQLTDAELFEKYERLAKVAGD